MGRGPLSDLEPRCILDIGYRILLLLSSSFAFVGEAGCLSLLQPHALMTILSSAVSY